MRASQLKQQLHNYIETAEPKKLKDIYTLLQDEIPYSGDLSKEQLEELDRRIEEHKNGKGKTYTWDEVNKHLDEALASVAQKV